MASNDSQNVISRKCVRSPSVRRRTITPWLPGVSRYSLSPDSWSTSKYASAFDASVTPCHVRAIIQSLRSGIRVGEKNPLPPNDGCRLSNRTADLDRASLDDDPDRIPANPVSEVTVRRDPEDEDVRQLPGLQVPDLGSHADRVGRVDRRSDDCLRREKAVVVARQRDRELRGLTPGIRVEIGPEGDRNAGRKGATTARNRERGARRGRGEQAPGARGPGGAMVSVRGRVKRGVRRCRADSRGENRASGVGEFVRRDFRAEARRFRPRENASTLVHGEKLVVDEHIAERSETRTRDRVDHLACDQFDVRVYATLEFGGNRMRSEEGPNHIDAGRLATFRRGPEDLQLILGPKSVSALHLDRRRPEGEHRSKAFRGGAGQIFLVGLSRRTYGMEDAASAGRDLSITHPLRLPLDLVFAGAREHRMGVRVHKAWQDRLSGRVDRHAGVGMSAEDVRSRPDVHDSFTFGVDGSILDEPEVLRHFAPAGARRSSQRDQLGRVDDEEGPLSGRPFVAGPADFVGLGPSHERVATPIGSDLTTNAFPPAARIASTVSAGRSESATMLPPPPAPVSFAP